MSETTGVSEWLEAGLDVCFLVHTARSHPVGRQWVSVALIVLHPVWTNPEISFFLAFLVEISYRI